MSQMIMTKEIQGRPDRRYVRRSRAAAIGLVAAIAGVVLVGGTAHAAQTPSTQMTFSPARISAGTQPDLTFTSLDAPSGALFILQESTDNGTQWKSVERTNATAGSSYLPAASAGTYEYRVLMMQGSTVLAASAPTTLTVTASGGTVPTPAPSPTPTAASAAVAAPASAPPSSGLPWMEFIVKPMWDAIIDAIIGWIFSLF